MIKRFLSIFYTDLQWKALSLFAAFLLWVVVASMIDPIGNEPFNLRLQLHNDNILLRDQIVLLNEEELRDKMIQVVVRGPMRELEVLRVREPEFIAGMFIPSIDFRTINPADVLNADEPVVLPLSISANLYPGFEQLSIRPGYVEVMLDIVTTQLFPLDVEPVGEVTPGFELRNIQLSSSHVNVTGARSKVEDIAFVGVQADVSGVDDATELVGLPIKVVNNSGEDITDWMHLSVAEVTAGVFVWPFSPLDVVVNTMGQLATGFAVAYINVEPIDIVAPPDRQDELDYIQAEISLSGENDTFTREVDITQWLPEGVRLREGASGYVDVQVVVEPVETRVLNIPRGNIRVHGVEAIYQILGEAAPVRVAISGAASVVSQIGVGDIDLELDLRHLSVGIHDRWLSVTLPEGVNLIGSRPILQVQIHDPAPPQEEELDEYEEYGRSE